MPIYEWYEVVTRTTPFEQGDFFDNVPILKWPYIGPFLPCPYHLTCQP